MEKSKIHKDTIASELQLLIDGVISKEQAVEEITAYIRWRDRKIMKKLTVSVMFEYEIEIDETNHIVKEYGDDEELIADCASRNFGSNLPVIGSGAVKLLDSTIVGVYIE